MYYLHDMCLFAFPKPHLGTTTTCVSDPRGISDASYFTVDRNFLPKRTDQQRSISVVMRTYWRIRPRLLLLCAELSLMAFLSTFSTAFPYIFPSLHTYVVLALGVVELLLVSVF